MVFGEKALLGEEKSLWGEKRQGFFGGGKPFFWRAATFWSKLAFFGEEGRSCTLEEKFWGER